MCTGMFGGPPPTVNSRGDVLSKMDFSTLTGFTNKAFGYEGKQINLTPQQRGEMLFNWLTAGGVPKRKDPGETFKESQDFSGTRAKGAAGQGMAGLFGAGMMIGDLTPKTADLTPKGGDNSASPMQPGVPYSAVPLPRMVGGR